MLVKDVMNDHPLVIGPEASVLDAKEIMKKNKETKLAVVDKNGVLVGLLTNADLIKVSPSNATTLDMYELGYLLSKMSVEKAMVKNVKTTNVEQTVEEAARLMKDYGITCLPVVDGDILIGMITQTDLFECFIEMFSTKNPGIRAVVIVDEKPGILAKIAEAVAAKNGNIVSLVTSDVPDEKRRKITIKISGITETETKNLLVDCCCQMEDVRSV
ncbi:CBS domain-containing protein [Treponema sp.]|uniref:CBS domain-containing protein n=1 Tax=Treponema sp. TaxID=166 RepID=UPI002A81C4A5|nr:CBS domain-containing protein [Treponema sp.]MDY4132882.1 CBS domain-containing protein [Treponema sp.]